MPALTALAASSIWCQWCLGHLNRQELITFLKRSQRSLLNPTPPSALSSSSSSGSAPRPSSYIIVKENVCDDLPNPAGGPDLPNEVYDEEDSSITRSTLSWLGVFEEAGLKVVKEEIQGGLPEGLFVVKR